MKKLFTTSIFLIFFNSSYSQSYFIPQYNSVDATKSQKSEYDKNLKIDILLDDAFWSANYDTVKQDILETISTQTSLKSLKVLLNDNKLFIAANFLDEDYELINTKTKVLKEKNTNGLLLTKVKKTKTFYLWESGLYDVETFNGFFSKTGLSAFSNVSIQAFDKATYINAELISFYFNYVRLGVSGSLKATNNAETDSESIKQDLTTILHNSGSLNLNFSMPLIFNRDRNDHIHYGLFAETSIGLTPNFEEANNNAYFSNDILVNHQLGLNLKFDISSNETAKEKQARFLIEFPVHYSYGNNRSYQLLDISDHTTMRVNIGAVLGDKISFRVSGPMLSTKDKIMKTPFLFSLNFAPANL